MKKVKYLPGLLLMTIITACGTESPVLHPVMHYDKPANSEIEADGRGYGPYMREALLLGNGRLGTMFTGGINDEHLVINDITLWMNGVRGLDEDLQCGSRKGSYENLELVREAYREGRYGSGENSMEAMSTKYLSRKEPLGNYAPFADLFISTGHDSASVTDYQRQLDLRTGLGLVSYQIDGKLYTREYFCSYPNDVTVVRYTSGNTKMELSIKANTHHKINLLESNNNRIILKAEAAMAKDNMEFMQLVQVDPGKGKVTPRSDGSLLVSEATDIIIYLAAYSDYLPVYPSFKGRDYQAECEKTIQAAEKKGFKSLKKAHVSDISPRMDRCRLELDFQPSGLTTDKLRALEDRTELQQLYFDYGRYLQLCCSRSATVPSNLQGLWNANLKPPWDCDYHIDINLAMNYWMVETANLPECFTPYMEWMKVIAESGRHTAREAWGTSKGWSIGLTSNIFGFTAPNEHGRRMMHPGHWLCQNLYEHYSFSQDRDFLEEIYPIIKGAAEFYVEFLAPWKDGTLVVYPTWSPENCFLPLEYGKLNKQTYGASYDQQLIYNLFTDCIEASTILDKDEAFRKSLQEMIPKLCPQKVGRLGQLQEWPEDLDDPDNMWGHNESPLIALHPGRDISLLTNKELAEAARVSLDHRTSPGGGGGWGGAWAVSFWARLQDGERAYPYVAAARSANLFNGQIDANFGVPAGICEMLLQSHLRSIDNSAEKIGDAAFVAYKKDETVPNHFIPVVPDETIAEAPYILHLLPALPPAWQKGKITGLRARGGFEVDIEWESGQLVRAIIQANTDGAFRIYSENMLSEVISLSKGQSISWPEKEK